MIVPSMTLNEIHKELFSDLRTLESKIESCKNDFKRKVLKSSRYPFNHTYNCRTRLKKNLFLVTLHAPKRSDWEKPLIGVCGIYDRPEGKYAAALSLQMNMATIYPPHFFRRYRERIAKDMTCSSDDIIKLHFTRNCWGIVAAHSDEKYKGVYDVFEPGLNDDVSFACVNSEGLCFGERQGNITVVKTIVSEDMLFDDQKEVFAKLKLDFELSNKSMFGKNYFG